MGQRLLGQLVRRAHHRRIDLDGLPVAANDDARLALHRDAAGAHGAVDRTAEEESIAALVEARDGTFLCEAELDPRRDLVALDEGVDLLHTFTLSKRQDEGALAWCWTGTKVDDPHRARPSIDQKAEGYGVVLEEDFVDGLLLRRQLARVARHGTPSLRRHIPTHPVRTCPGC